MMHLSIRARLTAWYVAVLAVATLTLTGASWWLSTQSVMRAADVSLQARVEGVRHFLENPRTRLTVDGLQDEFGEYAELTRGEALLEVIDPSGVVLVRPAVPGWIEMADAESRSGTLAEASARDFIVGRLPFRVASARIEGLGGTYGVTVAAPMGPAYDALNQFHRLLIGLVPAILVLAGVGGYLVSRRALAPVDRVTRAVQAITLQSLDQRVDVPAANDEIRRLAVTFNAVLTRLQSAVSDIVRFTADASHELRTPVALVRTTAELALRRERTPHEYRAALAEILDHTGRMSTLVDDLLVLARTDAGIEARQDTTFDLLEVVRKTCQEAAVLAERRHVELCVDAPDDFTIVRGDRVSLQRLLLILLDNAVKYSPDGGTVELRVAREQRDGGRDVVITVSDEGIGLDAADVPRIFERFYRGKRARRHAPEGNGLGLAIARTIADQHQWALDLAPATAQTSASGCRVEVRLPLDGGAALDNALELRIVPA